MLEMFLVMVETRVGLEERKRMGSDVLILKKQPASLEGSNLPVPLVVADAKKVLLMFPGHAGFDS